jgi:hypothetical protein
MRRPRVSLSFLIFLAAIAAFQCGVLVSVLRGQPLFGLRYCLDTGLIPTTTVFGIGLFMVVTDRRWRRPSLLAFVVVGGLIVVAHVVACRTNPELMATPVLYYINRVEPWLMDANTLELYEVYILSLVVRGLIFAVPQVLLAALAGFAVHVVFGRSGQVGFNSSDF